MSALAVLGDIPLMEVSRPLGSVRRELAVNTQRFFKVFTRNRSFFRSRKEADVVACPAEVYPGSPFLSVSFETHADEARSVVPLLRFVHCILAVIGKAKVLPTIVFSFAVTVIHDGRRPPSGHVDPSNARGFRRELPSKLDVEVSRLRASTGRFAGVSSVPFLRVTWARPPSERPGLWVVVKYLSDFFGREVRTFLFHRKPLLFCVGTSLAATPPEVNKRGIS